MSAPEKRYLVSIGSFVSEKSAIDRLEAARRSGFSGEIVDDANNPTVNIVAAIVCIGEVLAKLTEQVSAISEKIEPAQAESAQSAPAQADPSNEKLKAFGAKLESNRKLLGLSRKDVAAKIGACVGSVRAWELGISVPQTRYIKAVCEVYGVEMDDVVGLT